MERKRILIVEDETIIASDLQESLIDIGFDVISIVTTGEEAVEIVQKVLPDIILMDIILEGKMDGTEAAEIIREKYNIPVIFITAYSDDEKLLKAKKSNPYGYIIKPFDEKVLYSNIMMAISNFEINKKQQEKYLLIDKKLKHLKKNNSLITNQLRKMVKHNFIGESTSIKKISEQAFIASKHKHTNVLISGESGTGKEVIARIIHFSNPEVNGYFCAVNCSAIPETLIESEFFGHEKGSFTGAISRNIGYFEQADHGTLFLDEIGDMPYHLQAILLRVIEEKKIKRIGGTKEIDVEFRVIAATNRDIYDMVDRKKFRLDLLHRLNTLHSHILPLRERPDDIRCLLDFYIDQFSKLTNIKVKSIDENIYKKMASYNFPGNVRELKNLAERAIIHCKNGILTLDDFPISQTNKKLSQNLLQDIDLNLT